MMLCFIVIVLILVKGERTNNSFASKFSGLRRIRIRVSKTVEHDPDLNYFNPDPQH